MMVIALNDMGGIYSFDSYRSGTLAFDGYQFCHMGPLSLLVNIYMRRRDIDNAKRRYVSEGSVLYF